jgi:hypothetical protein
LLLELIEIFLTFTFNVLEIQEKTALIDII